MFDNLLPTSPASYAAARTRIWSKAVLFVAKAASANGSGSFTITGGAKVTAVVVGGVILAATYISGGSGSSATVTPTALAASAANANQAALATGQDQGYVTKISGGNPTAATGSYTPPNVSRPTGSITPPIVPQGASATGVVTSVSGGQPTAVNGSYTPPNIPAGRYATATESS